jgi:hypothetical protein
VRIRIREKVGGDVKVAIHGLDPGIPAGMPASVGLQCLFIVLAGTMSGGRVGSRPETVGGDGWVAIHGLGPGIPAGMTA